MCPTGSWNKIIVSCGGSCARKLVLGGLEGVCGIASQHIGRYQSIFVVGIAVIEIRTVSVNDILYGHVYSSLVEHP